MKYILLILTFIISSAFASEGNLSGLWSVRDTYNGDAIRFIPIEGLFHAHTQEKFILPDGKLSYTIDQAVKLRANSNGQIEGSADFFDSRGCSYRDQPIVGELQSGAVMNLLMTIPRYKLVTITTGTTPGRYDRPIYCDARSEYYPYRYYRYICGYDRGTRSRRTECRLVETIQVPVSLKRVAQ